MSIWRTGREHTNGRFEREADVGPADTVRDSIEINLDEWANQQALQALGCWELTRDKGTNQFKTTNDTEPGDHPIFTAESCYSSCLTPEFLKQLLNLRDT